jgi:hypothetical protein
MGWNSDASTRFDSSRRLDDGTWESRVLLSWGSAKGDCDSGGFVNGSVGWASSESERVGDGVGLTLICVSGTISILSCDRRAIWLPKPLNDECLDFRPDQIWLARRDTSPTKDGGDDIEAELRAAFLRSRSAISHLLRF